MKTILFNKSGIYNISDYARLKGVNRRTIYNRIKNPDTLTFEVIGSDYRQRIKISQEENNLLFKRGGSKDFSSLNINDLSIVELASLCTFYQIKSSPDSHDKLALFTTELENRLSTSGI